MTEDPWKTFDALSAEDQERVYRSVEKRRMVGYGSERDISDREIGELAKLLKLLEREREQRECAEVLLEYLPGGPHYRS